MPALISQEEREKQINSQCSDKGFCFIKWDEKYKGKNTKFTCFCPNHGEWSVSVNNFLNHKKGCPKCYKPGYAQKISKEEYENRMLKILDGTKYSFVRWYDKTFGIKSKIIVNCSEHGEWSTELTTIIHSNKRCKGCAVRGFKTSLPGTVYALRSKDGLYVKVGISNRVKKRITDLKLGTPFEFDVIEMVKFQNGKDAVALEKMFHEEFCSARFKNFDGAREWMHWDEKVTDWFRLFQK